MIDFHLRHNGEGKMDEGFYACRTALEKKYGRLMQARSVKTTCTNVLLMPSDQKRRRYRLLLDLRWYRRAVWKWIRGKPLPAKD